MKKKITIAALIGILSIAANAAEQTTAIIDLPAQEIHYGAIPALIDQSVPEMPNSISGVDGHVLLQFNISEAGRVSDIQVIRSSNDKLAKYSKAMVRRWAFENPGGHVTALQPIIFEADNEFPTLLAANSL